MGKKILAHILGGHTIVGKQDSHCAVFLFLGSYDETLLFQRPQVNENGNTKVTRKDDA